MNKTTRKLLVGFGFALILVSANTLLADVRLNAQHGPGEPGWDGKVFLQGEARAIKDATPILERPYRPLHVYGNLQRRHHYRDTVVPSRTDRQDRRHAFLHSR